MISPFKRSYEWMGSVINSPNADLALGVLFYFEAVLFLPADPILMLYCFKRKERAYYYATIATISSVIGGITSYAMGFFLWNYAGEYIIHNKIVGYVLTPARFFSLAAQYQTHEWKALLAAGFIFIPYKAITLSAGFCKVALLPFIICSFIVRGFRFFLVAILCKFFGEHIKDTLQKYFNLILLFAVILILLCIWLFT